jgi:hypothetical protein
MTEEQWLTCTDPRPMLFPHPGHSGRKLRLFTAACYRQAAEFYPDHPAFDAAAEAVEGYAEGRIGRADLVAAFLAHRHLFPGVENLRLDRSEVHYAAWMADWAAGQARLSGAWAGEVEAGQADLLRDVVGNPCRPVTVSPAWRTPQVVALAQAAYDQRELPAGTLDVVRLAVLADALEDAGCDQADLLAHLRGPGPHVRGCWAVDLILGKQ